MSGRRVMQFLRSRIEMDVPAVTNWFCVFPQRTAFMWERKTEGSAAWARCDAAASLTMEAIGAAGTPCPETSAIRRPACC